MMGKRIAKYIVSFEADIFNPKNAVTTCSHFSCSIVLYPDVYPNETRVSDIAVMHAWYKATSYLFSSDSHGVPLSIRVENVSEVEEK